MPLTAQLGEFLPDPNFPGGSHKIDVGSIAANAGCLGCARDSQGNYYVSARFSTTGQKNKLYMFGANGALISTFDQPIGYSGTAAPGVSPWGIRDLAYDGRYVYGGCETTATNKVMAFDTTTGTWDPSKDWTAPAVATVRALAYDPNGNGGQGSMWTADFSANVVEFDRNGVALSTIPSANLVSPGQIAAFYGAGYDPSRKTVWFFSQGGSTITTSAPGGRVVAFEVDTLSRTATGQVYLGDRTIASSTVLGGIAGGCEFYTKNGKPTLLCLTQASSDTIYEMYGSFNLGTRCGGEIGFHGDALYSGVTGNPLWAVDLTKSPTQVGAGYLVIAGAQLSYPVGNPFAPGCMLHFDLAQPFVLAGAAAISNGAASFPLPVPANLGPGNLVFQWVELANGAVTLLASDAGWATLYP